MKKFRFLSSLTLASVIVSGTVLAATGTTKMWGEYTNGELRNANNSSVVAFQLTDPSDRVTVDEIKDLGGYTNVNANGKTEVTTGDFITTNGTSEHKNVVVYGDVNGDGEVNLADVLYASDIQGNMTQSHPGHTELNTEAADVQNNGVIELNDVISISDFYGNTNLNYVKNVPETSKTPVVENKFDFTVNENNIVNSSNAGNSKKSKITIKSKNGRVEDETSFDLYYIDKDGKEQPIAASGLTIVKYADEMEEAVEVDLNAIATPENEGKEITLVLKKQDQEEIVGTTKVKIDMTQPEAVEISARRDGGSYTARLSFKGLIDSDIVKAYYKVGGDTINETEVNKLVENGTAKEGVKTFEGLSNSCDDKLLDAIKDEELKAGESVKVYFVVEDSAGNLSKKVYTAIIPTDKATPTKEKAPKGADETENKDKVTYDDKLNFTWDTEDNQNGYIVRVRDEEGNIIKEYEANKKDSETSNLEPTLSEVMSKIGKYFVEVVVKGKPDDASQPTTDSDPIKSDVVEVKQLDPVTDITFTADPITPAKATLTWKDVEHKDDKADKYVVTISKYKGTGEVDDDGNWEPATEVKVKVGTQEKSEVEIPAEKLEVSLEDMGKDTLYKATVQVMAEDTANQKLVKDSEPETSKTNYFWVDGSTFKIDQSKSTNNSVTIEPNIPETLGNIEFTYEVDTMLPKNGGYDETIHVEGTTVTTDKDGNIVVSGLEEGKEYKFVVKMKSKTGNVEGTTSKDMDNILTGETKLTVPEVKGTITTNEDTALKDSTKVYYNAQKNLIIANGKKYENVNQASEYYDPDKLLSIATTLLGQLQENDIVNSITKDAISITNGTQGKSITLDFSALHGEDGESNAIKTLEISGNGWSQEIGEITGVDKLTITEGEFTFNGVTASDTFEIELGNGASVLEATTGVTLAAGANVSVNHVNINATKGAKITSITDQTFTFKPAEDESNTIDINNVSGKDISITFDTDAKTGNRQLGKITIKSNAKVTVATTNNATIKDVDVSTTNGDVDISDDVITGKVNVTVTTKGEGKTNKITGNINYEGGAPFTLKGLELKKYTDAELNPEEGTVTVPGLRAEDSSTYTANEDNATTLTNYLKTFEKLFGKGVKINVTEESNSIELIVPENTTVSVSDLLVGTE